MSLLSFFFPKYAAKKEAAEQRQALKEAWRHEERMKLVRLLMGSGRGRR